MSKIKDISSRKSAEPEIESSDLAKENKDDAITVNRIGKGDHILNNEDIEINRKKPSDHLISLIENLGKSYADLKKLASRIKEIGKEEGFSSLELTLLARHILQKKKNFSSRQLNHWFPLKGNWESTAKEESTSQRSQFENNDANKDTEKSLGPASRDPAIKGFPPVSTRNGVQEVDDLRVGSDFHPASSVTHPEMISKPKNTISFSDIISPDTIDCTNHPMYRRATETIVKLRHDLFRKDNQLKQAKVKDSKETRNRVESPLQGDVNGAGTASDSYRR
jgi:hypothetical protein